MTSGPGEGIITSSKQINGRSTTERGQQKSHRKHLSTQKGSIRVREEHKYRVKPRSSSSSAHGKKNSDDGASANEQSHNEGKSPFSVLSSLIAENAHLKEINQSNLLKHSIHQAEDELIELERKFGEKKNYIISPKDIESLSNRARLAEHGDRDLVRDFLENRYGNLPPQFEAVENKENQSMNLPYSGSSFLRELPHHSKIPNPPSSWLC
ncbi:hypothetical protein XU18_3325 [Perkinsela sp. CCAP 1560/4]|nr:hypothetical protein XU18_3325 [Perkinsela sp. CCAP 1560/4]|eukprot:KNH05657.1 hypothetical protein XU18_3325 [Perkinsela sp. CCAP 1560/4]